MSPMEQEQGPFQGEGDDERKVASVLNSSKPFLGFADYSDVNELIPDKPIVKSQEAK